jgi:alkanesulfonate monooxygenase SsuD/methylene tetrahydromethanopterin reductase-like flavin-dependent oxidoreductase (luciferase family)
MSMKYSVVLPQMGMQTTDIHDPVEKFEAMIRVAQTADECGYEAVWLADHFQPVVAGPARQHWRVRPNGCVSARR